jgi:hypothetical protein
MCLIEGAFIGEKNFEHIYTFIVVVFSHSCPKTEGGPCRDECPYIWSAANQFTVKPEQVTPFLYNSVLYTSSSSQSHFTYSTLDLVLPRFGLVLN